MNKSIINNIDNLVIQATDYKECLNIPEYQYIKGKISGMFLSYMSFDFLEEANYCNTVLGNYPFVGNPKIDIKKFFNLENTNE